MPDSSGQKESKRKCTQRQNHNILRANQPLTNDQLMRVAPSIFATEPWQEMSERYTFIPTIAIVEKMRSEGFIPYAAAQSRTRVPGKQDFTKHMIRFRDTRNGDAPVIRSLGTIYPELILTNAHDGASARCGYTWRPRKEVGKPRACPSCKQHKWDTVSKWKEQGK